MRVRLLSPGLMVLTPQFVRLRNPAERFGIAAWAESFGIMERRPPGSAASTP
jgi:hypothetical protein